MSNSENSLVNNKVYLRYVSGEEGRMDLALKMKLPSGTVRDFNFSRRENDTVEAALDRMKLNILKRFVKKKKKKNISSDIADEEQATDIDIKLMNGSEPWDPNTVCKVAWTGPDSYLKIGENNYTISLNPPKVKKLKLPVCMLSGYTVIPQLDTEFTELTKSRFEWYREDHVPVSPDIDSGSRKRRRSGSTTKVVYSLVGSTFMYKPSSDDIGKKLKLVCTPSDGIREGELVECLSKEIVAEGPRDCPFFHRQKLTSTPCDGAR